jgi:hypothetical protein
MRAREKQRERGKWGGSVYYYLTQKMFVRWRSRLDAFPIKPLFQHEVVVQVVFGTPTNHLCMQVVTNLNLCMQVETNPLYVGIQAACCCAGTATEILEKEVEGEVAHSSG